MDLLILVVILLVVLNVIQGWMAHKLFLQLANRLQGPSVLPPAYNEKIQPTKVEPEQETIMDLEDAIGQPDLLKNIVEKYDVTENGITEVMV